MLENNLPSNNHHNHVSLSAKDPDFANLKKIIQKLPELVNSRLSLLYFFRVIHQKMNQGISHDEILNILFDILDSIIPFDRIGIALTEKDNKFIRLNWVKSKLDVKHLMKNYAVSLKDTSLGEILGSKVPRILNDLEDYYRLHPRSHSTKLALLDGIRSSLTCPLTINGQAVGVIFFSSSKPDTYKNLHVDLFSEISEGLSLVIDQSLMKKDVQEIKRKEKLFRDTLHDLNNPLNVIRSSVTLMKHEPWYIGLSSEAKMTLDIINRNSEAMISLIHDFVYIDKEKKGEISFSGANCKLEDFLEEVMADFEAMAKAKDIKISLKKIGKLPAKVNFDAFKIKEALLNYISNAIKFSKENTQVRVEVCLKENEKLLHFSVIDQGQGIPESELYKLFQDYSTTSTKPTSGEPSIGLGLANVKRIVEMHQGEVFVTSKLGVGSNFGFWIPV